PRSAQRPRGRGAIQSDNGLRPRPRRGGAARHGLQRRLRLPGPLRRQRRPRRRRPPLGLPPRRLRQGRLRPRHHMANGVAVTPQDEALVAGSFRGTADFDPGPGEAVFSGTSDAFLASYAGDGTYRWALVLGSPDGYAEPRALASLP